MRADLAGGRPNGGTFVPALYVAWFRIKKLRKESGPVSERVSPLPPNNEYKGGDAAVTRWVVEPQGAGSSLFSDSELRGQFLRHRHVLQLHIIGYAILEWRIGFADDQRRQIAARRLGDAKTVLSDKVGRQQLFLVGDLRERCGDNVPAIGCIAEPADRRHHRALPGDREFDRRATDRVGLL